jgi:hypothetical protein
MDEVPADYILNSNGDVVDPVSAFEQPATGD